MLSYRDSVLGRSQKTKTSQAKEQGCEMPTTMKVSQCNYSPPNEIVNTRRTHGRYGSQVNTVINQLLDDTSEKYDGSTFGNQNPYDPKIELKNYIKQTDSTVKTYEKKHLQGSKKTEQTNVISSSKQHQSPRIHQDRPQDKSTVLIQEYEKEILRLKMALNQQIKHNNDLIGQISILKEQNHRMRRIAEEGKKSKEKVPLSVMKTLSELKSENEQLRKETIKLLRKEHFDDD